MNFQFHSAFCETHEFYIACAYACFRYVLTSTLHVCAFSTFDSLFSSVDVGPCCEFHHAYLQSWQCWVRSLWPTHTPQQTHTLDCNIHVEHANYCASSLRHGGDFYSRFVCTNAGVAGVVRVLLARGCNKPAFFLVTNQLKLTWRCVVFAAAAAASAPEKRC